MSLEKGAKKFGEPRWKAEEMEEKKGGNGRKERGAARGGVGASREGGGVGEDVKKKDTKREKIA